MKLDFINIWYYIIWGFIITIIGLLICCGTNNKSISPIKEIIYVPITDTTNINELVLVKELLRKTKDSLEIYKNDTTISSNEFVLKYKIERIKYYNEIAGKGNNIKFLRGWINRTLNE